MDLGLWQSHRDQENVPRNPAVPDVKIHAKRKIIRDGVEEVWEQGVMSGPHGDIPFARPVKRSGTHSRGQPAYPGVSASQQQQALPQADDDTIAQDQGLPPKHLPAHADTQTRAVVEQPPPNTLPAHADAEARPAADKQLAAAAAAAAEGDAAGEVSVSEDESEYDCEYDPAVEVPRLQHTPFGPDDVAQLRVVLHKLREVTEVDAEPSTAPGPDEWDDVITRTCAHISGMQQTPELTLRLRHEMAMLEAAAASAMQKAHERQLVRRLAEMRQVHRQWQQQVGEQADEQLAEWSGHAVAQQLLDKAGADREEFLQRLEDKVARMQLLVESRQKREDECRWLTTELVERFGHVRPTPAEITPLPDHGSRTKNVAMAIHALITQHFTEDDEP